ncbi:uncharacterized protein PV07_03116 [Cladophialophora immunda]|uniref:Zn(2)-C6 fungal-type domain-containing protein n=2 Tax=Cladophialophora immunda TaxID=569365 RepID=A0A0D2CJY9_9EURO|nr:uncharacterized protein PV07_03116 [Cladophialophora immunda]KIW31468.1 hypothetical protein PV07_03116 [Cladophialophora immunda]
MTRPAACILCRQDKLRCNASATFPDPCARCASRNRTCKIDANYRRISTVNRMELLSRELCRMAGAHPRQQQRQPQQREIDILNDSNFPSIQLHTNPCVNTTPTQGTCLESTSTSPARISAMTQTFQLNDLTLSKSDVGELFQEFFMYYHDQLPMLEKDIDAPAVFDASPLLFWVIILTATRNLESHHTHFQSLCKKMPMLLGKLMSQRDDSVHTMQALLILSMWPLPVNRQSDDMRWVHSGMAMQMAMQAGFHRVGYEQEYHGLTYSKSSADERKHTRIWRAWCFVNAMLSCEFGLPCLVPFDSLDIKPVDEACLPPDFLSKLRLALYISRINDSLGDKTKDNNYRTRTTRLLDKDLENLAATLRRARGQWTCSVEFVLLSIRLNMYAFSLRQPPSASTPDLDHTLLQSSVAKCACRLINIYVSSPLPTLNTSNPGLCLQKYCHKFYFRSVYAALLTLLKISMLNQISPQELGEVNNSIRLGHCAIKSCSTTEGDEYERVAGMVELLCKKGVIESASGRYSVESRLGASLWLELLASAIHWRRLNSMPKTRERDSNTDNLRSDVSSSMLNGPPGSVEKELDTAFSTTNDMGVAMAEAQSNPNLYPYSIQDWSTYPDPAWRCWDLSVEPPWWGVPGE